MSYEQYLQRVMKDIIASPVPNIYTVWWSHLSVSQRKTLFDRIVKNKRSTIEYLVSIARVRWDKLKDDDKKMIVEAYKAGMS